MKRLTYKDNSLPRKTKDGDTIEAYSDYDMRAIINRLSAYEDTGLEPEEVERVHETLLTVQEKKSIMWNDLQKYLQAEADGRLVALPCKIGDDVWFIFLGTIEHGKVSMLQQKVDGTWKFRISHGSSVFDRFASDFGKIVFLTREEAEAAIGKDR